MRTRRVEVSKPLLAVVDLVDKGHAVLFDETGSFAVHKRTGRKLQFHRRGQGWDFDTELEAPANANKTMTQVLAEVREIKAKKGKPAVELAVEREVEEPDRAVPIFRLAVRDRT